MKKAGRIRIGISGWTYAPWRGTFYPKALPRRQELAFAARKFDAIEINTTFYGLQRPKSFGRWRDETPESFVFCVKGSRYITHMLKLRNIETALANFMASGLLRLGTKLGPILWQFSPQMTFDADLFRSFLQMLPTTTAAAQALALRHDNRMEGRTWLTCDTDGPLRHAIEIRHESFRDPNFIALLQEHEAALVCADTVDWPLLMDLTADFVYCRLHGSEELYVSGYDESALDQWSKRVTAWAQGREAPDGQRVKAPSKRRPGGRDVFVFFDNDAKVKAPANATALARRLNVQLE
ncbi:DUF72 domain-containing protein [Rhodoligotrophos appendicifer]|uniref:DUF72 domain-containing protein n=1 Tax=Rhodoligotrophos appendicifer TaxID=987056 RepID=UPI001186D60B|nr:DUF72 domain-containing protein [Rhodoligotrophos appendicifer]